METVEALGKFLPDVDRPNAGVFAWLDEDDASTVDLRGNSSLVTDCGVASNSTSASSLTLVGSARLKAPLVLAAGGISVVGAGRIVSDDQQAWVAPIVDPYGPAGRDLRVPAGGGCSFTGEQVNGTKTLGPGRYCGGLRISGNGTITFTPGLYVLHDGDLQVAGNTRLVGNHVTFVFTGSAPGSIGGVRANGTLDAQLSAPPAGSGAPYEGVLMFQDPRALSTQGGARIVNRINGNAGLRLKGALYFPSQAIEYSGSSEVAGSCLQVVARWVELKGTARSVIQGTTENCDLAGAARLTRRKASLVE